MKKTLGALLVLALGLIVTSVTFAYTGTYTAGLGINGTPHDLSTNKNGLGYAAVPADAHTRICIFCHAPHNAYKLSLANGGPASGVGAGPEAGDAFDYLPLWNHTLQTNLAYSMYYAGPGAPATGHAAQQTRNNQVPGSVSLLCLSCHDGSVAVNSYGNSAQPATSISTGTGMIGAGYQIGKDAYLGNHHPIGFSYGAVQAADSEIRAASHAMGTAGTVQTHLYSSQVLGANDTMECGTCHSVHNKGNTGETLLWRSDVNSQLCLTCHDKGTDPLALP